MGFSNQNRRSLLAVAAAGLAMAGMGLTAGPVSTSPTSGQGLNAAHSLESFERSVSRAMAMHGGYNADFFHTLGITSGRFRHMSGEGFVKHRRPGERAHRTWRLARASGRR